ncbi:RepC [Rhizobium mesoamericanum STM3625]|uniref:RepC n=1 Tax=Rhizobium mesoamericanum STM3625 TaxID=1211777 RepID=K0Q6D7_9HYPH|nr:RepC [Rhizobium mesoamericanum STM3625]
MTRAQLAGLAQTLTCTGLINGTESHLLVAIISTAPAESFDPSGRPIIFKSNRQLAFEIGRSAGRVSRLLSRLFDAGLITMRDSGNYKRYPIRNCRGEIMDGCGIDLRILIARYTELSELVRQARIEKRETDAACRRYRGALRAARYALSTVEQHSKQILRHIGARVDRIDVLVGTARSASSKVLRRATVLLERLIEWLMRIPRKAAEAQEMESTTCTGVENDIHIPITSPYISVESSNTWSSANANPTRNSIFEKSLELGENEISYSQNLPKAAVALQDVIKAVPILQVYGLAPKSWAELVRFMPLMCRFAGISEDARSRAVERMGEQQAAVAVAVTLEKYSRQEVNSPGGYLRAMTNRASLGDLHLARSVFGLAARNYKEAIK